MIIYSLSFKRAKQTKDNQSIYVCCFSGPLNHQPQTAGPFDVGYESSGAILFNRDRWARWVCVPGSTFKNHCGFVGLLRPGFAIMNQWIKINNINLNISINLIKPGSATPRNHILWAISGKLNNFEAVLHKQSTIYWGPNCHVSFTILSVWVKIINPKFMEPWMNNDPIFVDALIHQLWPHTHPWNMRNHIIPNRIKKSMKPATKVIFAQWLLLLHSIFVWFSDIWDHHAFFVANIKFYHVLPPVERSNFRMFDVPMENCPFIDDS